MSEDSNLAAKVENYEKNIAKLERENRSLNQYNEELRAQVNLLSAKLSSINKYLLRTVEVQTDLQIDCKLVLGSSAAGGGGGDGEGDGEDKQKQTKLELDNFLSNLKSEAMQDYVYDASSKTYYSTTTGWYYYPESGAYYNPKDQSYYTYDIVTKKFTSFHSIKQQESSKSDETGEAKKNSRKRTESDLNNSDDQANMEDEEEEEEGEIVDAADDNDKDNIDFDDQHSTPSRSPSPKHKSSGMVMRWQKKLMSNSRLSNVSPIRLIVLKSATLELGSLMLVSCLGGNVGQAASCTVSIPDLPVSQRHAEISYDSRRKVYNLRDLDSRNGTFVNGQQLLAASKETQLRHGDVITFADTELLAHIHPSRDVTCDECEPGTAMAKLASKRAAEAAAVAANNVGAASKAANETTVNARQRMKDLKKKYGLKGDTFREYQMPAGYQDRAGKRQKEVGSDNPFEKTAAGSALDM